MTTAEEKRISVAPYKHDCKKCIWVGWISQTKRLGNMYFCPQNDSRHGSIIIRFSDEPGDYWSSAIWENAEPHSIGMSEEIAKELGVIS